MPDEIQEADVIETPNEAEATAERAMQRLVDRACEEMTKAGQKLSQRAVISKVREINPTGAGPTFNAVGDMISDWQERQRRAEEMPKDVASAMAAESDQMNGRIYVLLEKHFAARRAEVEAELANVRGYVDEVEAERDKLKTALAAEQEAKKAAEDDAAAARRELDTIRGQIEGLREALRLKKEAEEGIANAARAEGYEQARKEAEEAAKKPAKKRGVKSAAPFQDEEGTA